MKRASSIPSLRFKVIFLFILSSFFIGPDFCRAEYDYINISNPFLRKIPIAVPLFKTMSDNPKEAAASRKASALLSETLAFTSYFKILDRAAFLGEPSKTGIVITTINFRDWTGIGAELLVTGGVFIKDDVIDMELRLFDTFKERMLIGKRYKGRITDQRKIIRRFCNEIIYRLTGERGIFSSQIAFLSTGTGAKEVFICDFDGYNRRQITNNKNINLSPAWSSDGNWIAYTSYKNGKPDLYIKQLNGRRGAIVARKGINITPAWVPGKLALAATLSFSGDPEIYMLTGTGKITKRLTKSWGIDVSPDFSPDGGKMAFVSRRTGTPQIYIQDLDSGHTRRLTYQGRYNTTPSWSPRGDKIAYCGSDSGRFNIYVINVDGSGSVQLTHDAGDNESPSWSPDGNLIAFSSTREGPSRIYVMTAYGTDQRRLLAVKGEQMNPKWSLNVINH